MDVFGEETMGFQPEQTDRDPFDYSSGSEEESSCEDCLGSG